MSKNLKQTMVTQYFDKVTKKVQYDTVSSSNVKSINSIDQAYMHLLDSPFTPHSQTQVTTSVVRRLFTNSSKNKHSLDQWIQIQNQSKNWPYLPKMIIYNIFRFLDLKECVKCALVCKFWKICYHNIYFSYCFFKDFELQRYSANELEAVFRRTSVSMKHIKKIREMLKGQKLGPLIKKTRLTTSLSQNYEQKGSLLESFQLEPKKQQCCVFLTDKDLLSICQDSSKSLQYMSLVSCQFMTGSGFEPIKNCRNLIYLQIQHNSLIKDVNLMTILTQLKLLRSLLLINCQSLSGGVISIVSESCTQLERLDLSCNPQIELQEIKKLQYLQQMTSLSLKECDVNNTTIEQLIQFTPYLNTINLEGCHQLNTYTLILLLKLKLRRINLSRIAFTESEIYNFVLKQPLLKVCRVNNNLNSQRVEKLLQLR